MSKLTHSFLPLVCMFAFLSYLPSLIAQNLIVSDWEVEIYNGQFLSCKEVAPENPHQSLAIMLLPNQSELDLATESLARQLAGFGYRVVIPELGEMPSFSFNNVYAHELDQVLHSMRAGMRGLEKIAVLGIGWGGTQAFELATQSREPDAVLVIDGRGPKRPAYCSRISAPVYGFYGGASADAQNRVQQLNRYMVASSKSFDATVYPTAYPGYFMAESTAARRMTGQVAKQETLEKIRQICSELSKNSE